MTRVAGWVRALGLLWFWLWIANYANRNLKGSRHNMDLLPIQPASPAGGNAVLAAKRAGVAVADRPFAVAMRSAESVRTATGINKEAESHGQIAPAQMLDLIAALIPAQLANQSGPATNPLAELLSSMSLGQPNSPQSG